MALPTHLANCLRRVEARQVATEANRISFKGGVFRLVGNWNVLCPFGFGDLTVDANTRQIQYRLSFRQLFFVATALTGFLGICASFELRSWPAVPFIPLIWAWLFGGNLILGIPRFEAFLRGAIETAPRMK
jgi:hypothetical protein